MAGTSTKDALPYPTLPDTRDVPRDFLALVNAIDGKMVYPCTAATRPTGGARFSGRLIYETDTKAYGWWDGTAWIMHDTQVQSQTGTSVIVTNGTQMTNYTATRRWVRQGRTMRAIWSFVAGAGFTAGTGNILLTMPAGIVIDVTMQDMVWGQWVMATTGSPAGSWTGGVMGLGADGTQVGCSYFGGAGVGVTPVSPGSNAPGQFLSTNYLRASALVNVA